MAALAEIEGTYILDPMHTRIGFITTHAMVTDLRGSFDEFEGMASMRAGGRDGKVSIVMSVASVNTRNRMRDDHLRNSDFFDVARFPTMSFHSTEVTVLEDRVLRVAGDLTIKGVAKPVTVDFQYGGTSLDNFGNERIGFAGATRVRRSSWGLTYNASLETGGVLISDETTLEFEISAIKRKFR